MMKTELQDIHLTWDIQWDVHVPAYSCMPEKKKETRKEYRPTYISNVIVMFHINPKDH